MTRLPTPGGDDNQWGDVLNDFLSVEHNADGSQKPLPQSRITNLTADLTNEAAARVAADLLRPLKANLSINVKEAPYNAVGNDIADDTAAIQAAITAAAALGTAESPATIVFPPGVYHVTSLRPRSNVIFEGKGGVLKRHIATASTLNALFFWFQSEAAPLTNVTWRNMRLIGEGRTAAAEATQMGIHVYLGSDVRIEGCTITDFPSAAINIERVQRVQIIGNTVRNVCRPGGRNAINASVDRVTASDTSTNVPYEVLVTGNTVTDFPTAGIAIVSLVSPTPSPYSVPRRALIANNVIDSSIVESTGFACIAIEASRHYLTDIVVADNQCRQQNPAPAIIAANNSTDDDLYVARVSITGNQIQSAGSGISTEGEQILISGNNIEILADSTGWGMFVGGRSAEYAPGVTITSNQIIHKGLGIGLQAFYLDGAMIAGNRIAHTLQGTPGTTSLVVLSDSDGVSYMGNVLDGSQGTALYLSGAFINGVVKGNRVRNACQQASPPAGAESGIRYAMTDATIGDFLIIANNDITDSRATKNTRIGIRSDNAGVNKAYLSNNQVIGLLNIDSVTANITLPQIASAATLAIPGAGDTFEVTGTTNIGALRWGLPGRRVTLKFAGILTVADSATAKLSAALVTAADTTLSLMCLGSTWVETGRSAN